MFAALIFRHAVEAYFEFYVTVRLRLAINRVEIREVSSIEYRISATHFQTIRTFLHSVDSGAICLYKMHNDDDLL